MILIMIKEQIRFILELYRLMYFVSRGILNFMNAYSGYYTRSSYGSLIDSCLVLIYILLLVRWVFK